MGIISSGIQSIAMERARQTSKIEKIHSEVTEAVADDAVASAVSDMYKESMDDIDMSELMALMEELPESAADEKMEIARILAVEDDTIDIDDIVGISLNAE